MTSAEGPRNGVWPVTIAQSVTPREYRSERMSTCTPANCSGLANSGVPTNAGSDQRRDFQRQLYLEPAGAFDETLERLFLYELHRVEVTAPGSAQMQHRGNV
jgi:hypothetical protein